MLKEIEEIEKNWDIFTKEKRKEILYKRISKDYEEYCKLVE